MAQHDWPRFLPLGDAALLIEFGDGIDEAINRRVRSLAALLAQESLDGLGEAVPTYRSLLVHYDPLRLDYAAIERWVWERTNRAETFPLPPPRRVEMPTVYGGAFGPDIEFVAAHNGLSVQDVIRIHSGSTYPVFMLGFTPGFPYLGGLDAAIAAPRLDTPRTHVPAGSVGIAGQQTGIYPIDSPGGWRIIGRTPLKLFDPYRSPPTLLAAGDCVHFVPVSEEEFERLSASA
ncbi:MAG: 5-oxoprolinase subunit PxpB [Chloroflexota bacterium]